RVALPEVLLDRPDDPRSDVEWPAEHPVHPGVAEVLGAQVRPKVQDVPERLREPEVEHPAGALDRCAEPDAVRVVRGEVAGGARERRRSPVGDRERGQADRQRTRAGRKQRAVSSAEAALALPGPAAVARQHAKRRAAWRRRGLVLLLMSPWIVGFTAFFGYPLVSSVFLSFTHYAPLSSPRWGGLANYKFLFEKDQQVWPAVKNTLWLMVIFVPLQVLFAFGVALMLSRARRGIGFFRTVFYLPALAPVVAATLAFVYLLNPATGPVNIALGHLGIQGPLWFNSPSWSKPSLTL